MHEAAVVVRRGTKILLVQRPPEGRWARLWEFPHGPLQVEETHEAAVLRILSELTGVRAELGELFLTVKHGVTRFRISLVCFEARFRGGRFASSFYRQGRWLEPAQLKDYPVSAPQRRLAQALVSSRQRQLF